MTQRNGNYPGRFPGRPDEPVKERGSSMEKSTYQGQSRQKLAREPRYANPGKQIRRRCVDCTCIIAPENRDQCGWRIGTICVSG